MTDRRLVIMLHQEWFKPELEELGFTVVTVGYHKRFDVHLKVPGVSVLAVQRDVAKFLETRSEPMRAIAGTYLIYWDDSSPISIVGIEDSNIPVIFYSVDTHHHHVWHSQLSKCFDHVLVAQKDYVSRINCSGQVEWFPLWASTFADANTERPIDRSIDVCFRGNMVDKLHPKRLQFFNELSKYVAIDARSGKYLEDYSRAKIVVNEAVNADLNFRVFEALSCGALLITPAVKNGMEELFEAGKHLVTYSDGDAQDCAAKVKYYLEHDEERAQIAAAGRQHVMEHHSPMARAQRLAKLLDSVAISERAGKLEGAAVSFLHSSVLIKEVSADGFCSLLGYAANKLSAFARSGASMTESTELAVILSCHLLKKTGRWEMAEHLASVFAQSTSSQRYQGSNLFIAVYLDVLQSGGKSEQALEVAAKFSSTPRDLLQASSDAVREATTAIIDASTPKVQHALRGL